jgi:hypothetical protein
MEDVPTSRNYKTPRPQSSQIEEIALPAAPSTRLARLATVGLSQSLPVSEGIRPASPEALSPPKRPAVRAFADPQAQPQNYDPRPPTSTIPPRTGTRMLPVSPMHATPTSVSQPVSPSKGPHQSAHKGRSQPRPSVDPVTYNDEPRSIPSGAFPRRPPIENTARVSAKPMRRAMSLHTARRGSLQENGWLQTPPGVATSNSSLNSQLDPQSSGF